MKRIITLCLCFLAIISHADDIQDLLKDNQDTPLKEFIRWQQVARKYNDPLLDIAIIATVAKDSTPYERFMYISKVTDKGFVFSTNKDALKEMSLRNYDKVSLVFLWAQKATFLQVRVEGRAHKLGVADVKEPSKAAPVQSKPEDDYFEYIIEPNFVELSVTDKAIEVAKSSAIIYTKTKEQPKKQNKKIKDSKPKEAVVNVRPWNIEQKTYFYHRAKNESFNPNKTEEDKLQQKKEGKKLQVSNLW